MMSTRRPKRAAKAGSSRASSPRASPSGPSKIRLPVASSVRGRPRPSSSASAPQLGHHHAPARRQHDAVEQGDLRHHRGQAPGAGRRRGPLEHHHPPRRPAAQQRRRSPQPGRPGGSAAPRRRPPGAGSAGSPSAGSARRDAAAVTTSTRSGARASTASTSRAASPCPRSARRTTSEPSSTTPGADRPQLHGADHVAAVLGHHEVRPGEPGRVHPRRAPDQRPDRPARPPRPRAADRHGQSPSAVGSPKPAASLHDRRLTAVPLAARAAGF